MFLEVSRVAPAVAKRCTHVSGQHVRRLTDAQRSITFARRFKRQTARALCYSLVFTATLLCSGQIELAAASAEYTYYSKIRLRPCSQLFEGRATLELSYRISNVGTRYPITLLSQSVDPQAGEAIVQFNLPRNLGMQKMHIEAFCRMGSQVSAPSNQIAVSNCDFQATEDSDGDGIPDNLEDTNCNNFFDPGDRSNLHNADTDGDGVRDLVEIMEGTDPTDPGSSPRPYVFSGGAFDPDGDGNANPVVWRPATGTWYIRDFVQKGHHIGLQFGLPGDVPFTYQPKDRTSNVGVIRRFGTQLVWILNGPGFRFDNGHHAQILGFGLFGDNLIPGPWQRPGETNLAVARLFNGYWTFFILQTDGQVRQVVWGGNGDIPKVQDYDGDGIFDIAVFRPSNATYYIIRSSDGLASVVPFGTGTADHTVRGDVTGDGKDDLINWEPMTGMFSTPNAARSAGVPTLSMQLGLYYVHVPLSWNKQSGRTLFTVVDHQSGMRYIRPDNNPQADPVSLQWGLPGDSQG